MIDVEQSIMSWENYGEGRISFVPELFRMKWENDGVVLFRVFDAISMRPKNKHTLENTMKFSGFRSTVHLRKWLKETYNKIKLEML